MFRALVGINVQAAPSIVIIRTTRLVADTKVRLPLVVVVLCPGCSAASMAATYPVLQQ